MTIKTLKIFLTALLCTMTFVSCEKTPEDNPGDQPQEKPGEDPGNKPGDEPDTDGKTFKIDLTADDLTITMKVTPADAEIRYYFDIIDEYLLKTSGGDLDAILRMILEDRIAIHTDQGLSVEEAVKKITSQGPDSYTYEQIMKANTTFIGYAVQIDPAGKTVGEIVTDKITTRETYKSENVISIEVSDINVDKANLTFTTTNEDPWLYIVEPAELWKGVEDEEILKSVCAMYSLAELVTVGGRQTPVTQMTPETTYLVMAFGFDEGTYTTGLFKKEFTTLGSQGPVDGMTFKFEVLSLKANSIEAKVSGTPETALFYFDICKAGTPQDKVESALKKEIDQQIIDYGFESIVDYFAYMGTRGSGTYPFQGLKPNTDYQIYAVQVNESTGEFVGEWIFSDIITTPAK